MMQTSFILICFFSVNSLCKNIISYSFENEDSIENSAEKIFKNALGEARSQSYDNNIFFPSNSLSISYEYEQQVPSNSTIEASNHEYQANTTDVESDDDENEQESILSYSYTVSVQRKGAHYTSGALVGERWVLSTAAEFYNVRETIKLFRIRMGSVDCKKDGFLTPIKAISIHPSFVSGLPSFDISVLKTAAPAVSSPTLTPIDISKIVGKVIKGKFLTSYWPRIVVKEGVVPTTAKERVKYSSMRLSTQYLIPTAQCSESLLASDGLKLDNNSLCLRPVRTHHSDCMPDAGAPVVAADGIWGITSGWVSTSCPTVISPTIFTRISTQALRTWIHEHTQL